MLRNDRIIAVQRLKKLLIRHLRSIFRIPRLSQSDTSIRGDVGRVSREESSSKWRHELFSAFLEEDKSVSFESASESDPFPSSLIEFLHSHNLCQGYLTCSRGTLSDLRCGFFLTRHKPLPTFAEALFKEENQILNMSGFFLEVRNDVGTSSRMDIVSHLHVTFQNTKSGRRFGGHLIDCRSGNLRCDIVPLRGGTIKRVTDPHAGTMHIRVDGAKEEKTSANRTLIFALPPREEFPGGLRKIMTNRGIREGEIRFALGTLESANVLGLRGIEGIRPREGLEMISAQGRLVSRDRLCKIDAHLVERTGAYHSVRIQDGVVKDLVEGVLRIGC